MRFELECGNVDGFAKLLDYHWELSKKVDVGSGNTLIEQTFGSIEDLVDDKLVCGRLSIGLNMIRHIELIDTKICYYGKCISRSMLTKRKDSANIIVHFW